MADADPFAVGGLEGRVEFDPGIRVLDFSNADSQILQILDATKNGRTVIYRSNYRYSLGLGGQEEAWLVKNTRQLLDPLQLFERRLVMYGEVLTIETPISGYPTPKREVFIFDRPAGLFGYIADIPNQNVREGKMWKMIKIPKIGQKMDYTTSTMWPYQGCPEDKAEEMIKRAAEVFRREKRLLQKGKNLSKETKKLN